MIRLVVAVAIGAGLLLCHAEPSAGGVLETLSSSSVDIGMILTITAG